MAATQCPGCNTYVSVKGATSCPRCRAALPRKADAETSGGADGRPRASTWTPSPASTHARHATITPASPRAAKGRMWIRDILTWAALGSIVILIALIAYRVVVPSEETLHARKVSAALLQCQQRILGLAEYGNAETPPYVPNYGTKGEFDLGWQMGSFHFKNAYGASEKMSASCIGDLETGEIKQLTVNAKTIL